MATSPLDRPLHLTPYRVRNHADLIHKLPELLRVKRLGTVGSSVRGVGMYLYHQAVGASGHGCTRHRNDLVPNPCPVARIRDDRKMGKGLHDRDGRKIQHVTGVRVETSNTALTQNHVFVPFGKDILGRQEQLVDRGGHPALEQHRNIGSTSPTQHRKTTVASSADSTRPRR